ncbi:FAD-dependent oxidoreductase [Capillimicrobium parvum]|uniref:Ferredoxin--NADP reductase n=1 Tax=Capillimicrobium parvum TaxID=2884022 RepID=A0A9E6XV23_9ACTN|nr:FAD-dependent oxidoreductase [Capillimicrobium parvum]UGS34989.1 Ferredoxin--NADP reductase [Capillimicrobium parvum]
MAERLDLAVIGAGPFGLSVAAHLPDLRVRVFGEPMQTWRTRMPPEMRLRSDWEETSLSAPADRGSISIWAGAVGEPREEPIPLQKFLRYANWFRETFVPDTDPSDVVHVDRGGGVLRLVTAAGDEVDVRRIVVAVGVTPFPYAPPPFDAAMGDRISFAIDRQDYEPYRGRRVVVVGGGQGGLEAAALAVKAGAEVEVIVRSQVRWFTDREPYRPRGRLRQRIYRLAYPVVGYGPPPLNRLALHPDAYAALPAPARRSVARRILRAGGSPWVRGEIEGRVRFTEGTAVTALERRDDVVRLLLSDGSAREADAVVVSAGFRFALDRMRFLSPAVRAAIAVRDGWPVLDRWFRSSDPDVMFVGFAAERRFGPIARFVSGSRFTARRLSAGCAR